MLHPLSLIIPLMILLPNLFFFKFTPQNMPEEQSKQPFFSVLEGIGRFGTMLVPLFFPVHIQSSYDVLALVLMLLSLILYYGGWVNYFLSNRDYKRLFSPFLGIPVPLAVFPVVYFLLASEILHSYYLLIFGVVFAVGHIPNSLNIYRTFSRTK